MPETVATTRQPEPSGSSVRELTFGDAIREALREEMRRDPTVILYGEDVANFGGIFRITSGLKEQFGEERVGGRSCAPPPAAP